MIINSRVRLLNESDLDRVLQSPMYHSNYTINLNDAIEIEGDNNYLLSKVKIMLYIINKEKYNVMEYEEYSQNKSQLDLILDSPMYICKIRNI